MSYNPFPSFILQFRFILLILLLAASFAAAQNPEQYKGRQRNDSLLKSMSGTGKVSGNVADSLSKAPAEFASVALLRLRDSVPVAGSLTDEKGNFEIQEVPPGRFILKISSIGYADYSGPVLTITPEEQLVNLGKIFIHGKAKRLEEVDVTGEKSEFVNSLDRKVYNMDKNIVNTGGTATEVLRNIPSVTVDMDGNISLRGSGNVNVLIDGKPSGITGSTRQAVLQQVPASSIERIEVITNPSAKYDADGMAGIINIVTKKDKLKGINANISAGIGTNEKYNLAAGGNYRTKKFNLFANYSFRHEKRISTGESVRENFYGDSIFYNLSQSHGNQVSDMHVGKGGLEYYLNESVSLGASVTATMRNEERPEYITYQTENAQRVQTSSFIRDNMDEGDHSSLDYVIDFRKAFKKNKGELTAAASYSTSGRNSNDVINTLTDAYQLLLRQEVKNETDQSVGNFQADYTLNFSNAAKVEAGWKSVLRSIDAISNGKNYFPSSEISSDDPRFTDHFIYDEQIHAVYVTYSGKFNKFDYQAGVRGEDYLNGGRSKTIALDFDNEYQNIYPSGFIKYHLAKTQEVQASYSRRVNRPESRTLNPFIDFGDTLTLRKGNPELKPE